jgi:hypothetical protein
MARTGKKEHNKTQPKGTRRMPKKPISLGTPWAAVGRATKDEFKNTPRPAETQEQAAGGNQ